MSSDTNSELKGVEGSSQAHTYISTREAADEASFEDPSRSLGDPESELSCDTSSVVGRTGEAFFDNKWFNAEIVSTRMDDANTEKVIVRLIGTSQGREYNRGDVKLLQKAETEGFPVGKRVQAIWRDDGLWYNGLVDSHDESGNFMISFDGFEGKPELVLADQVREPIVVKTIPSEREVKTYTTPAGYVIPEKLKIDRTKDSEAAIAEKKRKIHHLKSHQRSEKHTEELTSTKNTWQQFQQKVARR
jgi:hypothetical protein